MNFLAFPRITPFIVLSAYLIASSPVHADCTQSGTSVACTGLDDDGFISQQSFDLRVLPGALVNNIISPSVIGSCPLSLPAIELGATSTVTIDGNISTGGVCGFGVSVGDTSRVENNGAVFTAGILGFGVVTGRDTIVQNHGLIATSGASGSAVLAGDNLQMTTGSTSRITTAGIGAHGIATADNAILTHHGSILTTADAASGITASANATITNHGTIETRANNAFGIHTGNNGQVTNTGDISSVLDRPAFPNIPTAGVLMEGDLATLTNTASASITASHIAVRFNVTNGANLMNAGHIAAVPAQRFDGTLATGGGAVVFAGGGVLENSGTITSHENAPAIQAAGSFRLTNRGRINGDIRLGNTDDTIILQSGSRIAGTLDAGAGADALFLIGEGSLDHAIQNIETLTKSGAGMWRIAHDLALTGQANIIDGTLLLDEGKRIQAATIGNLGIVQGSGRIAGTFENAGLVAPGTDTTFGRLSFQRYRQSEHGTLAIRLAPDGRSDSIAVSETADLQGTLALSYMLTSEVPSFAGGETYDIVIPEGENLATTSALTVSAPSLTFIRPRLASTANGGIGLELERISYSVAGQTAAQKSVGRLLDRLRSAPPDELAETFALLESSDIAFASETLRTFASDEPGAAQTLGFLTLGQVAATVHQQQAVALAHGTRTWASAFHRTGTTRNVQTPAYRTKGIASGLMTGGDATYLGVAVARTDGRATQQAMHSHTALDTTLVALSAFHAGPTFDLSGLIMYGASSAAMVRDRTLDDISQTLRTSSDSRLWLMRVDIEQPYTMSRFVLTPHVGTTYMRAVLDPSDEKEYLALRTESSRDHSLRMEAGLKAHISSGTWRPYGALTISAEILDTEARIPASLNGIPDSTFQLWGDSRRRLTLTATAGVAISLAPGLEALIAADIAANDLLAGRSLNGTLIYRW